MSSGRIEKHGVYDGIKTDMLNRVISNVRDMLISLSSDRDLLTNTGILDVSKLEESYDRMTLELDTRMAEKYRLFHAIFDDENIVSIVISYLMMDPLNYNNDYIERNIDTSTIPNVKTRKSTHSSSTSGSSNINVTITTTTVTTVETPSIIHEFVHVTGNNKNMNKIEHDSSLILNDNLDTEYISKCILARKKSLLYIANINHCFRSVYMQRIRSIYIRSSMHCKMPTYVKLFTENSTFQNVRYIEFNDFGTLSGLMKNNIQFPSLIRLTYCGCQWKLDDEKFGRDIPKLVKEFILHHIRCGSNVSGRKIVLNLLNVETPYKPMVKFRDKMKEMNVNVMLGRVVLEKEEKYRKK